MAGQTLGASNVSMKRVGDKVLQYEYEDRARLGFDKRVDALHEGNHKILRKVRIHVPSSDPRRFGRYEALMGRIIDVNQMRGHSILNRTLVDPLTKTRWKIMKPSSFFRLIARILKFFNILQFFHLGDSPAKSDYELKEVRTFWQWLFRRSSVDKLPLNLVKVDCPVAADESLKGLKYEDALTHVATTAYQRYEHDFRGNDEGEVGDIHSDFAILMQDGHLNLVSKDVAKFSREEALQALVHAKRHYESMYGKDKLRYAEHQARFSLDRMIMTVRVGKKVEPLTPEHVYRLNILLNGVESQDIRGLIGKLAECHQRTEAMDSNRSLAEVFAEWKAASRELFSGREEHGILALAAKKARCEPAQVTLEYFRTTFGQYLHAGNAGTRLQELTVEAYNDLIQIYLPDKEAQDRVFTGRKIESPVQGFYTIADHELYKAWIDQQELLQINNELREDVYTDLYTHQVRPLTQEEKQKRFDEKCAFVICKKHLFKQHPTEGYRIGELIPAPSTESGQKRWYQVSQMTAGHEGLMYYTLEPVGADSGLPSCLLPRSTAASRYAYEGEASVRNDCNPINAPGYEGIRFLKKPLAAIRKDHTIPTWVAYQHSAQQKLNAGVGSEEGLKEVQSRLERASSELDKDFAHNHPHKNLHDLVREFDTEFNDVTWRSASCGNFLTSITCFRWIAGGKSKYDRILMKYAHQFSREKIAKETSSQRTKRQRQEKKDALFLMEFIQKHAPRNKDKSLHEKYQELIDVIGDHIFHDRDSDFLDDWRRDLAKVGYYQSDSGWKNAAYRQAKTALNQLQERLAVYPGRLAAAENVEQKTEILKEWEATLRAHAELLSEDVASKKTNGLRIMGHSLGGSSAQVEAYVLTAGANRLPVPATQLTLRLYDDPGMCAEDNEHQQTFILDHKEVMKELETTIDVYYSHDYGDFVPTGGTGHFGGMNRRVKKIIDKRLKAAALNNEAGLTRALHRLVFENYGAVGLDETEKEQMAELGDTLESLDADQRATLEQLKRKVVKAFNDETGLNIQGFDNLKPADFLVSEKGRELLKQCYLKDFDSVFQVKTEIKQATSYALEPETGDTAFKHGTRFAQTRREKTGIIKVANQVGTKALAVDIKKNMRLLGDYVERTFPRDIHGKSFEDFKKHFPEVALDDGRVVQLYSDPALCVKIMAQSLRDHIHVKAIVTDPAAIQNLMRKAPDEASQYFILREKVAAGHMLSSEEKKTLEMLNQTYDGIHQIAYKLQRQTALCERLQRFAKREIAKERLARRRPGKRISNRQIAQEMKEMRVSQEELASATDGLIRSFQAEMHSLEDTQRKIRESMHPRKTKFLRKRADKMRKEILNTHKDLLHVIKKYYELELQENGNEARKRAAGGMRVVQVGREGLGDLSGGSKLTEQIVSKIWGFGALRTTAMQNFRRFVGTSVAPTFNKKKFQEETRTYQMIMKGHEDGLKYRDPMTRVLTVDDCRGVVLVGEA